MHAIGHKDEVLWMTNLILNISYFVDVNQVHYFRYVFYTCIAGNCIVDKNCLFFYSSAERQNSCGVAGLALNSSWSISRNEEQRHPVTVAFSFFQLPLFFSIFLEITCMTCITTHLFLFKFIPAYTLLLLIGE